MKTRHWPAGIPIVIFVLAASNCAGGNTAPGGGGSGRDTGGTGAGAGGSTSATGGASTTSGATGGNGAGAGGSGIGVDPGTPPASYRYIPLVVGATWTWNAIDSRTGLSGMAISKVEALDILTGAKSGIHAFRVRNNTPSGGTVNWQQDVGTSDVRHREQFLDLTGALTSDHLFAPSKLRLDESSTHLAAHATWTEIYTDTSTTATGTSVPATITATWTVEAVDESVTVPAGTFMCLRVHRVEAPSAFDSTFWFARGVGKVREAGYETRELVRYTIPH